MSSASFRICRLSFVHSVSAVGVKRGPKCAVITGDAMWTYVLEPYNLTLPGVRGRGGDAVVSIDLASIAFD